MSITPSQVNWKAKVIHLYGDRKIILSLSNLIFLYGLSAFEIAESISNKLDILTGNGHKFQLIKTEKYLN